MPIPATRFVRRLGPNVFEMFECIVHGRIKYHGGLVAIGVSSSPMPKCK